MSISPEQSRKFVENYRLWLEAETPAKARKYANALNGILGSAGSPLDVQLLRQRVREARLPDRFEVSFGHGASLKTANRLDLAVQLAQLRARRSARGIIAHL